MTPKTRRLVRLGAIVVLVAAGIVVWRMWPRDLTEPRCRNNLATLYIAAGRVVTGEDPAPPPPVRNQDALPPPPPLADLSNADIPSLDHVFRKLVTDFSLTPDESRYLLRTQGRDDAEARWSSRLAGAGEIVCPSDPAYEKKSGYFDLARSWTDLYDLPPPSYEWHPEPEVIARCMWHRLELLRDGSIRRY